MTEADLVRFRHGAQGTFDEASKSTLENEFGTARDDEVVVKILEKGSVQESEVRTHPSMHLSIIISSKSLLPYINLTPHSNNQQS